MREKKLGQPLQPKEEETKNFAKKGAATPKVGLDQWGTVTGLTFCS